MINVVPTYTVQIYVGLQEGYDGIVHSEHTAIALCQDYCDEHKLAVTVTPTNFVYVAGKEPGVVVGLINYPRFPSTPEEIVEHAIALATILREKLGQFRVSVVTPKQTILLGEE